MSDETRPLTDADLERMESRFRVPEDQRALCAEVKRLRAALTLANDAMNHMGDVLNGMDAVEPEDEVKTAPAFRAVRRALGITIPGVEE